MEFTVERATFADRIANASRVVEKRNTIPILGCILIDAAVGGKITLTATDLDLEYTASVRGQVESAGSFAIPANLLNDILRKVSTETVTISAKDDGKTIVSGGRSRFTLNHLFADDFPAIAVGALPNSFAIKGNDLITAIEKVRFAVSNEEVRYYLNGIYLHPDDGRIAMAATDGHRLAKTVLPIEAQAGAPGIIVPKKALGEILSIAKSSGAADVAVRFSDSKVQVEAPGSLLTSKLIEGTFPDYRRVIPSQDGREVAAIDTAEFAASVDRVSTVSSERGRAVRLNFQQGVIHFSVIDPNSGSAEESLDVVFTGAPLEIGFNSSYILDLMRVIGKQGARVYLQDAGSPTLFMPMEDSASTYVLMPMRV